jgi:uncharacterized protein YegJ (DUF2314 family)
MTSDTSANIGGYTLAKRCRHRLTPLVLLSFLTVGACDGNRPEEVKVVERVNEPDLIHIDNDDPRMVAATEKARATAPEFAQALAAPKLNQEAFAVKMRVTDGKATDYMWISDLSFDGQLFRGRLGNTPDAVTGVKLGDELAVKPGQLSDWMYVEDGRLVGGYTLRVIRVSPEVRARLEFRKCRFGSNDNAQPHAAGEPLRVGVRPQRIRWSSLRRPREDLGVQVCQR